MSKNLRIQIEGYHLKNEELMLRYIEGSEEAFDLLFNRIHHKVYAYVCKNLSDRNMRDDVTQNIFVKFHTTKEKYDASYPLDAWIFTIARSVLYDHLRKASKMELVEFQDFISDEIVQETEIDQVLINLPQKSRQVVELKYLDELTFEEIAIKLDTSSANVRQILSRAMRFLKKNEVKNGT